MGWVGRGRGGEGEDGGKFVDARPLGFGKGDEELSTLHLEVVGVLQLYVVCFRQTPVLLTRSFS